MPSSEMKKHETLSKMRARLKRASDGEKFISWHPDQFGFDKGTYAAVVVTTMDGQRKVYPARTSNEAKRIYSVL